jgi:hypothetical protein
MEEKVEKSFWNKPEGITGALFLGALIFGGGFLVATSFNALMTFILSTTGAFISLMVLGTVIFLALDSKSRALVGYMYKSVMRWLTSLFVNIDPMGVLKNYIGDLKSNLTKMNRQIGQLRGQMHKLKELILNNQKEINTNLDMASQASQANKQAQMLLKSRKAGRLQESNLKLEDLYKKMEVLYRVLAKMYENSEILVEDLTDQVMIKEQERNAMMASHSAMKSAMNVIKGDPDKKEIFDQALEVMADDVSKKMGEMERFMEVSQGFMQSIDLQNGIFEEEGLKMLEKWENESISLLLGEEKDKLILETKNSDDELDLDAPIRQPEKVGRVNQYDNLFD